MSSSSPETGLTSRQRDLVERIGVVHDRFGLPPAAGRILGLLLVSPEPELSFDRIRELLGLSKSSVSTGLNLLLQVGTVEYSTRPGDRKRYFRKQFRGWEKSFIQRVDGFFDLGDLLREALELRRGGTPESQQAILEMTEMLDFLKAEIHDALRRWNANIEDTGRVTRREND